MKNKKKPLKYLGVTLRFECQGQVTVDTDPSISVSSQECELCGPHEKVIYIIHKCEQCGLSHGVVVYES